LKEEQLLQKGLWLEYATLFWNVLECGFIIYAGIKASSVALFGFGIDSLIEIFASLVVIWHLKQINKKNEAIAEKLIGIAFFLISLYILGESFFTLTNHTHSKPSMLGMVSLALTLIVMFLLAYLKGKVGKKLNNSVLMKESRVTMIDGMLATSTLIGVSLNAFLHLWWADPFAGLIIVYYGMQEGIHALRAKN